MAAKTSVALRELTGPMRPPFLILTPACVLLGAGVAAWMGSPVSLGHFMLALVGGLAAHVSVNAFNEYFDFRSGLDAITRRTPFSGGSGTLPARPQAAPTALSTAIIGLAVVALVGVYFTWLRGPGLVPLGLLGMLVIVVYTTTFLRFPLLSLVSPGIGFGTLMVMGTAYAFTGRYTWTAFFASLVPFFLVSNLLLLNQFPDKEADASIGRRHYPITLGRRTAAYIYTLFLALAYLSIVTGVVLKLLPPLALLGLLTVVIALPAARTAIRRSDDIPNLVPAMGMNVLVNILTPILSALGLFLSR
jgi:1,4-dihydroxy-2-naphthoate octaprenyltransferase